MRQYTLKEAEDNLIGLKGTPERDQYEFELRLELIHDSEGEVSSSIENSHGRR